MQYEILDENLRREYKIKLKKNQEEYSLRYFINSPPSHNNFLGENCCREFLHLSGSRLYIIMFYKHVDTLWLDVSDIFLVFLNLFYGLRIIRQERCLPTLYNPVYEDGGIYSPVWMWNKTASVEK